MVMDLHSPLPPRSGTELFGESIPDWLNPASFLGSDFGPDDYISELRTFVPFETLRGELHTHLSSLKTDLINLINRDYSDFVSLSTNLIDVDSTVLRMRAPLLEIKENILNLRADVEASLLALQTRIAERFEANEARDVLEILLDTFHVVSKVEKLIMELPSNGESIRETRSVVLERIASEMHRLNFYISHAKVISYITLWTLIQLLLILLVELYGLFCSLNEC